MNEHKSTQPCGCDEGAGHICEWHTKMNTVSPEFEIVGDMVEISAAQASDMAGTAARIVQQIRYQQEISGPTNPRQPLGSKPGSDHMVEAHDIVNGDRMAAYGSPKPAYEGMAKVWSGLLDHKLKEPLTAEDVVILLTGMKLTREARKHKRDNLVDIHGYALVLAHVQADGQ